MISFISRTFLVSPGTAMGLAYVIIMIVGASDKAYVTAMALAGVGGMIIAALISIGLVYLANKFGWSEQKLSNW